MKTHGDTICLGLTVQIFIKKFRKFYRLRSGKHEVKISSLKIKKFKKIIENSKKKVNVLKYKNVSKITE